MANANLNIAVRKEWMLAQPWPWLGAGFALTLWSWLWTFTFGDIASDYRVIVLALGLLLTGSGVWLRWRDRQSVYLQAGRIPLIFLLGCLFGLICLGSICLFLASFFIAVPYGFNTAPLFLVLITSAPPAYFAARRCWNRDAKGDVEEEIALAFLAAAGICLLGSFTLYADSSIPSDWDTIRMFLRVATAVCLYGSALTLVSKGIRRIMLSVLIMVHFAGISSAVLSVPPAPWIIQQTWMRLFRPYLEFVYLNNAYHFYAPDPGPSNYLWFRVIYEGPPGKRDEGLWYKVPELDEKGRIKHPVALEYQRFLSVTEGITTPEPLPAESFFDNETKRWDLNPLYKNRLILLQGEVGPIAQEGVKGENWVIPLDPDLTPLAQVIKPNEASRRMLGSYARFVARKFQTHPDKPELKFKSVKVYRVIHWIPTVQWFNNRIPPTDPALYRPFYVGNYDADGILTAHQDPYLYWLLPSLREVRNDPESKIWDFARLHAGDEYWVRPAGSDRWVVADQKEEDMVRQKKLLPAVKGP